MKTFVQSFITFLNTLVLILFTANPLYTQKLLWQKPTYTPLIHDAVFLDTGNTILSVSSGDFWDISNSTVIVRWDAESGKMKDSIVFSNQDMRWKTSSPALTPDGSLVAFAYNDTTIGISKTKDFSLVVTIPKEMYNKGKLRFSSVGNLLAIPKYQKMGMRIFSIPEKRELLSFSTSATIDAYDISPDEQLLAYGDRSVVKIIEIASGKIIRELKGLSYEVLSLVFSPDGKRLAVGDGQRSLLIESLRIFDTETGQDVYGMAFQTDSAPLAFSPDGKQLVLNSMKVWDCETKKIVAQYDVLTKNGRTTEISTFLRFSSDGNTILASADNMAPLCGGMGVYTFSKIFVWNTQHKTPIQIIPNAYPNPISFSPNDSLFALESAVKGDIYIWKTQSGDFHSRIKTGANSILNICFLPDNKQLLWSQNDTLFAWNINEKTIDKSMKLPENISKISLSQDGSLIALSGIKLLFILRPSDWYMEKIIVADLDSVDALVFSSDNKRLLSTGKSGILRSWDIQSGRETSQVIENAVKIWNRGTEMSLSANGEYLSYQTLDAQELRRLSDGKVLGQVTKEELKDRDFLKREVLVSKNGRFLIFTSSLMENDARHSSMIQIWDMTTHKKVWSGTIYPDCGFGTDFLPQYSSLSPKENYLTHHSRFSTEGYGLRDLFSSNVVAENESASVLSQNFPNPFDTETIIPFVVAEVSAFVRGEVYDVLGIKVGEIGGKYFPYGSHHLRLESGNLANGVYVLKLEISGRTETRRLVKIR